MTKSYLNTFGKAKVMLDGLKGRKELPVGITTEMIQEIEELYTAASTANSEQEKLKAELKAKTLEFENKHKALLMKTSVAKKYIKLSIQKELWREFGIEDKR